MTVVYTIIILLLLIFVHETGHFVTAKLTGIRVNEFALGMGPRLFGFTRGETKYSFRAIPIGGFCAMEGEDEESDDERAFNKKPARVRALVLFAGSLMNVLLAIVLLSIVIFAGGEKATLELSKVAADSPAYADGLRPGDEIVSINGVRVTEWNEISPLLTQIVNEAPNEDTLLSLNVLRDGAETNIQTHFYMDENGRAKLGISPELLRSPAFFFKSFGYGAQATFMMGGMMFDVLGDLIKQEAGIEQMTGVIGIAVTIGDTVQYGFVYVVQLAALISLNLGIVNLIPFPALDGGRLIFLLIRKLTGKKITDKIEGRVHLVGILVLFGFMALITLQDIERFFING